MIEQHVVKISSFHLSPNFCTYKKFFQSLQRAGLMIIYSFPVLFLPARSYFFNHYKELDAFYILQTRCTCNIPNCNKSTDNSIHKASRGLPYRINFPMSGGTVTTTRTLGITNEAIGCMSWLNYSICSTKVTCIFVKRDRRVLRNTSWVCMRSSVTSLLFAEVESLPEVWGSPFCKLENNAKQKLTDFS